MLKQDLTCRALFQSGSTGHQHQDRQGAGPRNPADNTATPARQGARVAAFVQRLRELGWIEGRPVATEHRWGEGGRERYVEIAAVFVQLKVDITRAPPANFSRPANAAPQGAIRGRDAGGCDEPASHATAYRSRSAIVVLQWLWK